MLGENLTTRFRPAHIRLNGRHLIGWWWWNHAEDIFGNKDAPRHRRGLNAIRTDGMNRGHSQNASALTLSFKSNFLETILQAEPLGIGQLVVFREILIDEAVVRIEQLGDGSISI